MKKKGRTRREAPCFRKEIPEVFPEAIPETWRHSPIFPPLYAPQKNFKYRNPGRRQVAYFFFTQAARRCGVLLYENLKYTETSVGTARIFFTHFSRRCGVCTLAESIDLSISWLFFVQRPPLVVLIVTFYHGLESFQTKKGKQTLNWVRYRYFSCYVPFFYLRNPRASPPKLAFDWRTTPLCAGTLRRKIIQWPIPWARRVP